MRASHGLAQFGAFSAIELPGATEDHVLENARRLVPRRIQEQDVDEDRWVFYALDQGSDRWEADWLQRLFSEIRGGIEPGAPRAQVVGPHAGLQISSKSGAGAGSRAS